MRDHWWWRPGWRPGRRMYAWHITFRDQPAVLDLAARVRDAVRGVPGLDLVPGPWLHLTTQEVGFSDEVSRADLTAITVTEITLILLGRDERRYEWETLATVRLGAAGRL